MTALRESAGRSKKKMAVAGLMLATASASLLLLTEFPSGATGAGASAALAELVARSPGSRIGGIALKGKTKRTALAPAAPAGTAAPGQGAPIASVMGAGPAGPLATGPSGLGEFPSDFVAPAPGTPGIAPVIAQAPGGGFGFVPAPGGGGGVIVGPGGGGTPGGGSSVTPTPTPTPSPTVTPPVVVPTPGPTPNPTTPPPVSAVPEPATWLMLIAGFGFVGGSMRRRRRFTQLA